MTLADRFFGVELEVGNEVSQKYIEAVIKTATERTTVRTEGSTLWADSINNDYWHVKYDSSCGAQGRPYDHGWEVASFKAKGEKELTEICEITNALHYFGCKVNDNCGFHIHVDVADFSTDDMARTLAQWFKIEQWLCHAVPPRRVDNYFCKKLTSARKLTRSKKPEELVVWSKLKATDYRVHENPQKKYSLNLVNYSRYIESKCMGLPTEDLRTTIELRLPEGTLDAEDVRGWVCFFVNFVEKSRFAVMPKNLVVADSMPAFFKYAQLEDMRDDLVIDTKVWLLKRFLKFSGDETIKESISVGDFIE